MEHYTERTGPGQYRIRKEYLTIAEEGCTGPAADRLLKRAESAKNGYRFFPVAISDVLFSSFQSGPSSPSSRNTSRATWAMGRPPSMLRFWRARWAISSV